MRPDGEEAPTVALLPTVRLLDRALRSLGDAGRKEEACEIAAEGWAQLRQDSPRLAERLNGTLHYLTRDRFHARAAGAHDRSDREPEADIDLDVRSFAPARRHELILETFEGLQPSRAFVLINDHDPKPLYYQFEAELQGQFTWEALETGPEVWRVRIGRTAA
ncbi:MAG TPA: DUF2249 domain-containing protein [Trueperaceae bacterium]|nr:DUF2249 domain-containing protein [Trueperaceae bacterium]